MVRVVCVRCGSAVELTRTGTNRFSIRYGDESIYCDGEPRLPDECPDMEKALAAAMPRPGLRR